jgi:hypothetical protein
MPAPKTETFEMLKSETGHFSVANDLERSVRGVANHACCTVIENGLIVDKAVGIESYMHLVLEIGKMALSGQYKEILFKFYLGDAANQGEAIWGEKSFQAYDQFSDFNPSYVSNIRWVCEKIPPENRCLKLKSWSWHQMIAPLPVNEQQKWNEIALKQKALEGTGWCKTVKAMINDEKIKELIREVEDEDEKARWLTLAVQYKPAWTVMRDWIRGDKVPPGYQQPFALWVRDKLDGMQLEPDVRDDMVKLLHDLADGIKSKRVLVSEPS